MAQIYINIKLSADGKHSEVKEHNKEQKLMSMIFFSESWEEQHGKTKSESQGTFWGKYFLIENCLHI